MIYLLELLGTKSLMMSVYCVHNENFKQAYSHYYIRLGKLCTLVYVMRAQVSQHTGCYDWAHLCSHLGRLLCVQVASQVYTLSRKIQVNLTTVNSQYILSRGFKDLHNLNKDVHVHVGHVIQSV